jgi:acyl carrier protein
MNEKLKKVLADVFNLKENDINKDLTKDDVSSWDSLTQMDLVTSLESEFYIELEMLEIASLTSVKTIIDTLINKGVNLDS